MSSKTSTAPAKNIIALSTSDTTDFATRPRGIIVSSGIVVMVNDDNTTETLADGVLAVGIVHPISPKRINATTTTATIYGVY